ncbi:MAG: cytochrome C [Nitrospirae bacterium]|nr:cytochrome C [Nitrospirota bacterium]
MIWRLFLMLAILSLPAFALAEQKAKTIDELAKMYDSSSCKTCHAEIYAQWEKSHHARPLMGIKEGIFLIPVVEKSAFTPKDPKKATMKNFPCFKCHLPQALTSAEDSVAAEIAQAVLAKDKAKISKLQITCIVCHNEMAIIHRLQEGKPEKGVLYGSKAVPAHGDKTYTKVKKSVIMNQAIFCAQCHGTGPNFDAENPYQCATLYGSYIHAYIPAGGTQTCQECHMKPVNGKADHLIAPNWNDRPQSSELLKKAISLDVQTVGYQFLPKAGTHIPMVVVNTKVTTNAGHRIPDG